jgi:PhoPQ-activated pathogenicity-related protein
MPPETQVILEQFQSAFPITWRHEPAMRLFSCRTALLFSLWLCSAYGFPDGETALDRYVARPDATYAWKVVEEVAGSPITQYVIALKSQTWRTSRDVDRPVWEHWLTIVKPAHPASHTAFLYISGGANDGKPPRPADPLILRIAEATRSVVAELKMVPNQPLVFHKDGIGRKEDDLIGYTWDQYLKTGDETWPARLPMTKSAVRAMDCVQEFLASDRGGKTRIDKFVVAGGSKRGWTTWCTAAVDKRVAAAIPIVIDVVNVRASMQHHVAAYGFYAEAVGDYMKHNIMQRSEDPKLRELYAIEDPYSYRNRLTMPKFIVNAAGDQFFCPDSSQFYFDDLKGEKYLRYVPNADHSLKNTDALDSIIAFYWSVLHGKHRPQYSWTFEPDGSIRVDAEDKPKQVRLWQAHNPVARDFRVDTIGRAYSSTVLEEQGDGVYIANVDAPATGWTAYFVELTYDVGAPTPLKLTTAVHVVPDRLPFADIDPAKAPYEGVKHRAAK